MRRREAYANLALPAIMRRYRLRGRDAALATELGYGTCRAQGLLDAVIAACTDRPLNRVEPPLLDALRLGAYQLLRTRIPPHAAVDTTVDLVRETAGMRSAGFVNAVLRRVAEHDEPAWIAELAPDAATDPIGHAAFAHAHPRWIAQAFADALGADRDELEQALAADDTRPEVHLLAKPGLITADELAAASGGTPGPYSPYAVRLQAGAGDPGELAAIRDGHALVVDEGSQLAALALTRAPLDGPDEGRWLDLCAGPGGKAALLGGLAEIEGATLDAVEVSEQRAELVRGATAGLPVTVHVADGRERAATGGGLRPGAGGRAVHRAGGAAQAAGGTVAAPAVRRGRPGQAAARAAVRRAAAPAARRGVGLRDLLSARRGDPRGTDRDPAQARRHRRRRSTRAPRCRACRASARGRPCNCGRTATAPTRCSSHC